MNKKLMWIGGGVLGLGLIVAMAWAIASEEPPDPSIAFRDVTVEGANLPMMVQGVPDPAVGAVAPTLRGTDWDGNPVVIEPDGRPKVLIFLAHWCPHCQAEVPEIQAWINAGRLPADVDFYSVTIMNDHNRILWPPQDWLQGEGWTLPVLMDSQQAEAQLAYGANATPFYAVLDGQNRNLGRLSGRMGIAGIEALAAVARSGLGD